MKKSFLFILIFAFSVPIFAQWEVKANMGINFISAPSFKDYINQNFAVYGDELSSFNSAVMFSGEAGYFLTPESQVGLELGYLINSYTTTFISGKYEFSYNIIMPSLLYYLVIPGEGFQFKFGGGAGIRFVSVDETVPPLSTAESYSSTGFGVVLKADGNTTLGGNFYANIGADIRYDLNGEPQNNGNYIHNNINNENVKLNSLSIGIRLGISYIF